jgi:hypothetical protein
MYQVGDVTGDHRFTESKLLLLKPMDYALEDF